tara:strand:+ start:177 stop:548 length:372 start_codon:yes stop_codon:yes gene_type:complete
MGNITYKEARSFNRRLRNSWLADEIETEEYRAKEIDIGELVSYELETDANLPLSLKALFHTTNPNGLCALLDDDVKYGYKNAYAKYHYTELRRLMLLKRPGTWKVNYHLSELRSELKKIKEVA